MALGPSAGSESGPPLAGAANHAIRVYLPVGVRQNQSVFGVCNGRVLDVAAEKLAEGNLRNEGEKTRYGSGVGAAGRRQLSEKITRKNKVGRNCGGKL